MLAVKGGKEPSSYLHSTQNIKRLFSRLSGRTQPLLLDIGPPSGDNIQWLIQKGCKAYVEDCFQVLKGNGASPGKSGKSKNTPRTPLQAKLKEVLRQYPAQFDAILCWDFFDYMDIKQAVGVVRVLGALLKPHGFLFAFFNFNHTIPPIPMRYQIVSDNRLKYQNWAEELPPRRIHQNRDIQEIFAAFEIANSCLLNHQMREVLVEKII